MPLREGEATPRLRGAARDGGAPVARRIIRRRAVALRGHVTLLRGGLRPVVWAAKPSGHMLHWLAAGKFSNVHFGHAIPAGEAAGALQPAAAIGMA
eukprot:CAMPEP_0181209864 /NCGR_PEP_ID=MMETSP1096-20121128/22913_1 /TAXON_ID=156174 ORGANISM="Chrysochromulina ericina, Strain CCMP281" /NCGR_SAMPLE_ID=MMETSP1096 /ASSEMBLY_ACC=CAM_ASM_000453 /LENGTH=95 /DNA_ID=CAMNT_0023301093 /DNA_START=386 /DNA_END=670 /DNA_ORIENTATION=-